MNISHGLAETIKRPLRKAKRLVKNLKYIGKKRYCPICNRNSRIFGSYGVRQRSDAQCMFCGAIERHRLVWLFFQRKTDLFSGSSLKMLHVAPEAIFEELLRNQLGGNYLTADLFNPKAMVKMDITDIQYPDESFDAIYCSHVLEHVPDDKKAMREFHRVLKPNGWAILLVPIVGEHTIEDLSITDPAMRAKLYGQEDHVRSYGRDYKDRLKEAGFEVAEIYPEDFLSNEEIIRMGITKSAGEIFLCQRN